MNISISSKYVLNPKFAYNLFRISRPRHLTDFPSAPQNSNCLYRVVSCSSVSLVTCLLSTGTWSCTVHVWAKEKLICRLTWTVLGRAWAHWWTPEVRSVQQLLKMSLIERWPLWSPNLYSAFKSGWFWFDLICKIYKRFCRLY